MHDHTTTSEAAITPTETNGAAKIVLPPFDPEGAIAVLKSFYAGDPEEHRRTLELLMKALGEMPVTDGAHLLAESAAASTRPPIHFKAAGFTIQPHETESALRAFDTLCANDPEEQRETFEYLKRAMNETRAAQGEPLHFPNE